MAGKHGKNAELRVGLSKTRKTNITLSAHSDPGLAAKGVFASPDKNWVWFPRSEADAAVVTYQVTGPITKTLDSNSFNIHYADGSVRIPPEDFPNLIGGSVKADYTFETLDTIGSLLSDEREFELNLEAELVDTTTIGENYATNEEGIPEWSGSLNGMYLNPDRFKLAQPVSGTLPRFNLRLKPRPDKNTFWQGTVRFPSYSLSGGFDSAIERGTEFTGTGPLDLVEDGLPVFPGA